ncbi:phosphatase PAP2 family protein [Shewanella canadensis]|uniref:undecaprenyl-diphosphate phosphatase n=1 Tax=Shewanella canadensis TaxID=271096 RepID=A0A431WZI7_9GAMM|nr:phosphatase PAP2 family protein [Shewanella canadensis]RTR40926.1 phosphatase PAP2 family protein [Shewanella canadensis]
MKIKLKQIAVVISAGLLSTSALAQSEIFAGQSGTISDIGDVVQILLPAGGLAGSLWIGDTEGAWQLTKGVATTSAITHGLKFSYERLRPDGSEHNSFPSGHTSAAFSGAAYIHHRYGNAWGIPAYGAAAFVGASRVWANRHYLDDVMAGGSIAVLSSLYWTEPYNQSDFVISPTIGEGSVGLSLNYTPGRAGAKSDLSSKHKSDWGKVDKSYRNSYELFIGGADTNENSIQDAGSQAFDLYDFSRESEPHTYSSARVKWGMDEAQYLYFSFTPFESRDTSKLNEDIHFGGKQYRAGKEVVSAYRLYGLTADYLFELLPNSDWKLDVGAGLSVNHLSIRLDDIEGDNLSEREDWFIAPAAMAEVGYQFTDSISANIGYRASISGTADSQDVWVSFDYRFNERWATSLVAGQFEQQISTNELTNDLSLAYGGFTVAYAF